MITIQMINGIEYTGWKIETNSITREVRFYIQDFVITINPKHIWKITITP